MSLKRTILVATLLATGAMFGSGCGSLMGRLDHVGLTGHPSGAWGLYPGARFDAAVVVGWDKEMNSPGDRVFCALDLIPTTVLDTLLLPLDVWQWIGR